MGLSRRRIAPLVAALICSIVTFMYPLKLSAALPAAAPQPEVKITGTITIRSGGIMNVRTANGKIVEVILTRYQDRKAGGSRWF
jgi:hypothetical protein